MAAAPAVVKVPSVVTPLLPPAELRQLRAALLRADFTVDGVTTAMGLVGEAALQRGDLAGCRLALRDAPPNPLVTLVRLFLLGDTVSTDAARAAFPGLPLASALTAGLLQPADAGAGSAGSGAAVGSDASVGAVVRAGVDVRPHGSDVATEPWWVVSDLGTDVRPGLLDPDHVLGVGPAALTLAGVVPRRPVGRALDVGTGSGVQALHLAGHSREVVATDVSDRALRFAATTWALSQPGSGRPDPDPGAEPPGPGPADHPPTLGLRRGSLLEPVVGERFDLVVANPPFVISPDRPSTSLATDRRAARFTYRDGGRAGDDLCRELVGALPGVLAPDGGAHVLANWLITGDQPWDERVLGWLDGAPDTDVWVWQREIADLGEYAALWLRDAGDGPDRRGYATRYDAWVDGLRDLGAVAIGMGQIHLRRAGRAGLTAPVRVADDVPGALIPPLGDTVSTWFERAGWLAAVDDHTLLGARLRVAAGVERIDTRELGGSAVRTTVLHQRDGLRWSVDADDAIATVVAACDGNRPLSLLLDLLALTRPELGDPDVVIARALPVVRDLVGRGFLEAA